MIKMIQEKKIRGFAICLPFLVWGIFPAPAVHAQPAQCQPGKVVGADACAKCHGNEVAVWRTTPHAQTFETLARNPRAREITQKLGMVSVKRNDLCINCHFTTQTQPDGNIQPVAGISCESCHGAALEWLQVHNDYGGPGVTHDSESPQHRVDRLERSAGLGMRNTRNLYLIASSCLNCHTVPQEELINRGGHTAGSAGFELVSWSQGLVRHNFVRSQGMRNEESTPQKLRVMYVTGLMADLEYSTRATARATVKADYGVTVASRAAAVALKLVAVQEMIHDPLVQTALEAFSQAELRTGNSGQLNAIADAIARAGSEFATTRDGSTLAALDPLLPPAAGYRHQ